VFNSIKKELDTKLRHATQLVEVCRKAKIDSDRAIALIHSGKPKAAASLIKSAEKKLAKAGVLLRAHPDLYATNMQINLAYQEYAEAQILVAILAAKPLPKLSVPAECYLTGLADAVGELNRAFLQARMRKDEVTANRLLERALEIDDLLKAFNYPDFVAANLRRKKDIVRIIINNMLTAQARVRE